MDEKAMIEAFVQRMPRDRRQKNGLFESDSELLELNGQIWALTLDQFSPEEDLFTSEDPEKLGANLVIATLSDLFATGAKPEFFLQGVTLPREDPLRFSEGLGRGIRRILGDVGCSLCGGDMGVATNWRFSGFAMGSFPTGRPLSRVMPKGNVSLWVTGTMGDANWAALAESPTPSFELRLKESRVIAQKACACMDTSGGFLEAVWCFHLLNPEFRFDVSLDLVPLAVGVSKEAEKRGVPWESFLLGGAGEYELFFALSEPVSSETREAMKAVGAVFVGVAQPNAENAGVFLRSDGNRVCRMESGPPCPREMGEREAYVKKVIEMAKQLRGKK